MLLENNRVCGRKRQRKPPDDITSDQPATKRRNCGAADPASWNPSPSFWDSLSQAHLTRRGLQEFDRRVSKEKAESRLFKTVVCNKRCPLTRGTLRQVRQLAQEGGPDLSHLRGFATEVSTRISRYSQSNNSSSNSTRTPTTKSTRSTPYNADYEQKLVDAGVYLDNRASKPVNWEEIHNRLATTRPSLSPSRFDDDQFEDFQRRCHRTGREVDVVHELLPIIEGTGHQHHSSRDAPFGRAQPFAEGIADAKPDSYDGAHLHEVDYRVRTSLSRLIVPTCDAKDPVVPSFFTELKGPKGRSDIAQKQAGHGGAIGARAMHAMQNYGQDTPVYDSKAYSFSNTYHGGTGTLQLYTHHPTGPTQPEDDPEYHMTQLNSFAMTGNSKSFREGATAYRNLRDYAKEQRDSFINEANERASTMPASTPSSRLTSTRSARTASFVEESDTSLDELSRDEVTVKRVRSTAQEDDRHVRSEPRASHQPVTDRHSAPILTQAKPTSTRTAPLPPTRVTTCRVRFRGVVGRSFDWEGESVIVPDDEWSKAKFEGRKAFLNREYNVWCYE